MRPKIFCAETFQCDTDWIHLTADNSPYPKSVPESLNELVAASADLLHRTANIVAHHSRCDSRRSENHANCELHSIRLESAALLDVGYPLKLYLLYFLARANRAASWSSTNGAAQPNLRHDTLLKHQRFRFPPLAEQQRIVAEVERRLSVVEELESVVNANLQRAIRLRQSILQRAFEGKLTPRYD